MNNHDFSNKNIILLHGLHMHAWAMQPLAKHLSAQGFCPNIFGYYSMLHSLAQHSERLNTWLLTRFDPTEPLLMVGHSLGGLVIRDFLYRYPNWHVPKVVTLGTPHNGSLSAHRIIKILPTFIGKSYTTGLDGNVPALRHGVVLGSIAGNVSAGLGKVVLPKNIGDNDGTVLLHETMLETQSDHIILPVSHTGMIFNTEVAKQVAYFLHNGYFYHENC